MAQLKACPPSKIRSAKLDARRHGMKYYVIFDNVMVDFRTVSQQCINAGMFKDLSRYDVRAIVTP